MEKSKVNFRCGADPEVFLQDAKGNPVSSIGYINADKWHPMQIPSMAEGFTLQEDNVTLEYGIPPASSADEYVAHIQAVMKKSLEYLPNLSFSNLSCIIFPKEQMTDPRAFIFGCEPDLNAWSGAINPRPEPPHEFMRSAGGHIHVETDKNPFDVACAMDLYLGVPSILMDKGEDRRKLYGKAGACRPKPYGVEYRTLSNFWIFEEKYIRWVWNQTERSINNKVDVFGSMDLILEAINNNNKEVARALVNEFNLEIV